MNVWKKIYEGKILSHQWFINTNNWWNETQDWRTSTLKNIRNLIVPTNNKPVNTMIIKSRVSLPRFTNFKPYEFIF